MIILSLETSTARGSAALWCDGGRGEIVSVNFDAARGHSGVLFSALAPLLEGGWRIDRVAVGRGPGSYTGMRVGIAVALGIAMGRGIPLAGLPSILALPVGERDYWVVGEAGRGRSYALRVADLRWDGRSILVDAARIGETIDGVRGSDPVVGPVALAGVAGMRVMTPSADLLAARVAGGACDGEDPGAQIEPIYLQGPCVMGDVGDRGEITGRTRV